jgi:hypothetical protein
VEILQTREIADTLSKRGNNPLGLVFFKADFDDEDIQQQRKKE